MVGRLLKYHASNESTSTAEWLKDTFAGTETQAGVRVTESSSLSLPALFCAVNLMSSLIASLPWPIYRRLPDGGREQDRTHKLHETLNMSANPRVTAAAFRRAFHLQLMLFGTARAEIKNNSVGRVDLDVLPSSTETNVDLVDGEFVVTHLVREQGGDARTLPDSDVVRVSGLGNNGIMGFITTAGNMKENVGLGLALQTYAASFFGNGTRLGVMFSTPGKMTPETMDANRQLIKSAHGGPGKAWRPFLATEGLKPERIGMDNDHAQTLEMLTFNVQDVARWTGVPPNLLMDFSRSTYSNVTETTRSFVKYALAPLCPHYEQEFSRKLLSDAERQTHFIKMNLDGLLRGDTTERYTAYASGINAGWLSRNEARRLEDMNAVDGLDEFLAPLNQAPVGGSGSDGGNDSPNPFAETGNMPDVAMSTPDANVPTRRERASELVESFVPVLADPIRRMMAIEQRAAARAYKKAYESKEPDALSEWATTYYADHVVKVIGAIGPAFESFGRLLGGVTDEQSFAFARGVAARHCEISRGLTTKQQDNESRDSYAEARASHELRAFVAEVIGE